MGGSNADGVVDEGYGSSASLTRGAIGGVYYYYHRKHKWNWGSKMFIVFNTNEQKVARGFHAQVFAFEAKPKTTEAPPTTAAPPGTEVTVPSAEAPVSTSETTTNKEAT